MISTSCIDLEYETYFLQKTSFLCTGVTPCFDIVVCIIFKFIAFSTRPFLVAEFSCLYDQLHLIGKPVCVVVANVESTCSFSSYYH